MGYEQVLDLFLDTTIKEMLKIWKTQTNKVPHKFKTELPAGKVMVTVFWNAEDILLVKFLHRMKNKIRKCYMVNLDMCFDP